MSTEIVKHETPALPTLYDAVDVADIQLPGIYLQTGNSQGVSNGISKPGDVILGLGAGDSDPEFLITEGQPTFDAYVIGRKKFAATTDENDRIVFHKDNRRDPDDPKSWEGFFFLLALPDIDPSIPARLMLWKTAGKTAIRKLNFFIDRAIKESNDTGNEFIPPHVRFSLLNRTGQKGHPYKAWEVVVIPVDDGVELARGMMSFGAYTATENDAPHEAAPSSDTPDI
jgi:hypothetical protein